LALAVVRDLRVARAPVTVDDLVALETDVLAGFVLARAAAGLADGTIASDVIHLEQVRAWLGKPLWDMEPADADVYFGKVLRDNAVITWTTEYYQLAVKDLRAGGRDVPDEILAHISPAHSENVNFFGVITVDVEAELGKLDGGGWRPLRPAAVEPSLRP
jgi:Tn3 transposase DDE domain